MMLMLMIVLVVLVAPVAVTIWAAITGRGKR